MIEQYIEQLIAQGKITRAEIDARIQAHKENIEDPYAEEVPALKKRVVDTENTMMFLLDMIMMRGML